MVYLYVALAVLAAVVVTGYLQPKWSWTGLHEDGTRPRTLWDWLGLLIIPLVIGAGGYLINQAQTSRDREGAARDAKQARALAADVRNAESLRAYLQQMSGLITTNKLADTADASVTGLATSLTLTVLRTLDGSRKGQVVQFLRDAQLIRNKSFAVDLYSADLRGAKLGGAYLIDAYFNTADFTNADFRGAILDEANFEDSNLAGVDFSGAGYADDDRGPAGFTGTCLTGARFNKAALSAADFTGAQGRDVDFSGADLDKANFTDAQLTNVDGRGTTYVNATLPKGWTKQRGLALPKREASKLCAEAVAAPR